MTASLRDRAAHGLFWSLTEHVGVQGLRFVISVFLARLLLPAEFGLVAMLGVFMSLADSVIDSGFGTALVQRKDLTRQDECSVFYLNIVMGIVMAAALSLAAPWISAFYNAPQLTAIARVYSIVLIIHSFGIVQSSLLTRDVDFRTQAKITLCTTPIAGVCAIVLAYFGWGVWSLVGQAIVRNLVQQVLLWSLCTWRPAWSFSIDSLRSLFSFGSRILAMGLINTVFQNIYLIIIGRLFSPADLGYYGRADATQQLPSMTLSRIVRRVTLPIFSSIQDDKERLCQAVRRILKMLAFLTFPLMIGIASTAKPLVLVLFTAKWAPCIPYLQLLVVMGMLYPLHVVNVNVLLAQGYSKLGLRIEVAKKTLTVLAIVVSFPFGILGLIYGQIIQSVIAYFLDAHYTGKFLGYTSRMQLMDCSPYLLASVAMGASVYGVRLLPLQTNLVLLLVQVVVGMCVYTTICCSLRLSACLEAQTMMKGWWGKIRATRLMVAARG